MGNAASASNSGAGSERARERELPHDVRIYLRVLRIRRIAASYGLSLLALFLVGLAVWMGGRAWLLALPGALGMLCLSVISHIMAAYVDYRSPGLIRRPGPWRPRDRRRE